MINANDYRLRLGIYKPHSRFDLLQLRELKGNNKSKGKNIETQLLHASIDGRSVLHEISKNLNALDKLYEHLLLLDLNSSKEGDDSSGFELILRRLHYALTYRQIKFHMDHSYSSDTVLTSMLDNPSFRDTLLRIGKLIPSFSLVQHYSD